jgi:hypothetical protein
MNRKEMYVIFGFAIALLIIIFSIAIISLRSTQSNNSSLTPTPTVAFVGNPQPPVRYDADAQDRLVDKDINRKTLSPSDQDAKNKIKALAQNTQTGVINQSANITLYYIQAADMVQVEIETTNITQAKQEANTWLRGQGLSQNGICNFPTMFFLNSDIANQLRNTNIVFNPLPEGC